MNIYLDMDGVVADFDEYAQRTVGAPPSTGIYPDEIWRQLAKNPRLYRDLKVKPGGKDLVDWVEYYRFTHFEQDITIAFLTAIPKDNDLPYSFYDKVRWAADNFPGLPVFFGPYSKDKWQHCRPGDILIDDRESNCQEWQAHGGLSFQYREWPECRAWLEETLKWKK